MDIVAERHWLKSSLVASSIYCDEMNKYYSDFKNVCQDIILIGTKEQTYDFFVKTGHQIKDTWKTEMKEEYLKMYKNNNNQLIIINL
tara:strand:- start:467 stop:727 length:261 start_codon:yes stop_codon:yes gene_type:complete